MLANDIRERIIADLTGFLIGDDATIMREFPLAPWGGAYADLAVLDVHAWSGYEIKSGADSLVRLKRQEAHYSRIFDRCYIVCDPRHTTKAKALLPPWWGVVECTPLQPGGGLALAIERHAEQAPVDAAAVAKLLRRDEARRWALERGDIGLLRGRRMGLAAELAARYTLPQIRERVRAEISARAGARLVPDTECVRM